MNESDEDIRAKGIRRPGDGSFAAFAIRNPHLIVVPCLIIAILGGLAVAMLPKDLLPAANLPAVQILSFYTGMPVEEISKSITERYEVYTGRAVGIDHQDSKSILGVSVVRDFFSPSLDLNTAIAQTSALVMSVLRKLPPGTQPPLILPFDPMASVPLALVAVSGDFPESKLNDIGRYDVENAIQIVPGAMAPTVMGGTERQIIAYLDPAKLKSYNVSPLDVVSLLGSYNTFVPSGDVKIGAYDYQIMSNGLAEHVEDMNDFPLRSDNGVSVYLKQLGHAEDAHSIQTNVVRVNGKPQVYVPVFRQPGANSIQVVDMLRASMKDLEGRLQGVTLTVVADQSEFIRHAIKSISEEAVIGGGLAALLVFLFLGNPRATGGILLSLPLSLLCAFIGLKAVGETINAMTLGGLALSIGVLVDNSIVVLENIMRKMAQGLSPADASAVGASEVMMPVLTSTIATLVVFFPIVFLSGVVKILFSSLAKSVMFAMVGSFLAASAVIPLFCARFMKAPAKDAPSNGFFHRTEQAVHKLARGYGHALYAAIWHRKKILVLVAIVLLGLSTLALKIGTELFPRSDAGSFIVDARLASGTRIEDTVAFSEKVETKLREWIPKRDLSMVITNAGLIYGFPAAFTQNSGTQDVFFNIELTANREHSTQYYAKIIRRRFKTDFPQAEIGVELGGLMTSALNGGLRSPIDVQIEGKTLERSHEYAAELAAKMKDIPGAVDVRVQQRDDTPQIKLDIDRKKAGGLGLTPDEVVKNVVSAVSGSSTFNPTIWVDPKTGYDYFLGVQVPEKLVSTFDELKNLPITGKRQDRVVPLGALAVLSQSKGPTEINHVNLRDVVDIYADAEGRDIGGVSGDIQKLISRTNFAPGYSAVIRGEISEMRNAVGSLGGGFVLAAVLVYLILVMQFRSFLLPAIIMATVPMGLVGIIVMLAATHTYFSIQAAIGAIFMIGIAVANGVLLIEFILHEVRHAEHRNGGQASAEMMDAAIVTGAQARLRPILMTSLASILGLVPMAVGLGHGSEANIPLGRAVIGGQLLSTALTLFIVPLLFRWLATSTTSEPSPEGAAAAKASDPATVPGIKAEAAVETAFDAIPSPATEEMPSPIQ
jgi:multidrug efflux pump subunit AcrB